MRLKNLLCLLAICLSQINTASAATNSLAGVPWVPPPIPTIPAPDAPAGVSFSRGIPLSEFIRLVLEQHLEVPFVIAPDVMANNATVGVSSKLTKKNAEPLFLQVLAANNLEVIKGPAWLIRTRPAPAPEPVADKAANLVLASYRPLHRPVSYFADALPGVFPDVAFSFQKSGNSKDGPGSAGSAGSDFFFASIDKSLKARLDDVVKSLDVPVPQVAIRALLMEVSADDRDGSGVSLAASLLGGKLGIQMGSAPTANSVVFKTGTVDLSFGMFAGDSRFKTIARPQLVTEHAKAADLTGGVQFPVMTTTIDGDKRTETPEYRDIGTTLKVTPQVIGSTITLSVQMELTDVSPTALGVTSLPTLLSRSLTSQVSLTSGSVAVIGGLTTTRETDTRSSLFSFTTSRDKSRSNSELVLILYATIMDTSATGREDGATAPDAPAS